MAGGTPTRASDPFTPRFNGESAETGTLTDLRALRDRLQRQRGGDDALFFGRSSVNEQTSPLKQSLQLQGVMGGSLGVRFERGGYRLPDFSALQSGASDVYGRAPGSQRMEFSADRLAVGSSAKLGAQWLRFSGPKGGGERLALSLNTGRLKLDGLMRELDADVRLGQDVAAPDRQLFGNEGGMRRMGLNVGYRAGARETLSLEETRLSAGKAGAERRRFAVAGRNDLLLAFETGQVDRKFDRIASLPEAEKKLFSREHGFRWREMSARYRPSKWALLDTNRYESRGEDGKGERSRERVQWTLTPSRSTRLLLMREDMQRTEGSGKSGESTTHLLQWEESLGSGMALRALRETVETEDGSQARTRLRHLWNLRANPKSPVQWNLEHETIDDPAADVEQVKAMLSRSLFKDWKLQASYSRVATEDVSDQSSYQLSLAGGLGRRWKLTTAALQRALGPGRAARKQTLALTGAPGVLSGPFRKTRLMLDFAHADGLPLAVAPMSRRARPAPSGTAPPDWDSMRILTEIPFARSLLIAGIHQYHLSRASAGGLSYDWRSTGKGALQWEARRNWIELENGLIVPRERKALRCRWRKSHIALASELNAEPAPGKPLLGRRESTAEFQTEVGRTKLGFAYGQNEDLLQETETLLRRVTVDSVLGPRGSFHFTYEDNRTPSPLPAIPDLRVALAFRQEFAPDRRVDFQAELRRWDGHQIQDDLTWRLDLLAMF